MLFHSIFNTRASIHFSSLCFCQEAKGITFNTCTLRKLLAVEICHPIRLAEFNRSLKIADEGYAINDTAVKWSVKVSYLDFLIGLIWCIQSWCQLLIEDFLEQIKADDIVKTKCRKGNSCSWLYRWFWHKMSSQVISGKIESCFYFHTSDVSFTKTWFSSPGLFLIRLPFIAVYICQFIKLCDNSIIWFSEDCNSSSNSLFSTTAQSDKLPWKDWKYLFWQQCECQSCQLAINAIVPFM